MRLHPTRVLCTALIASVLCGASPALAQSPADFYRGKTVTLLISSATGGGGPGR